MIAVGIGTAAAPAAIAEPDGTVQSDPAPLPGPSLPGPIEFAAPTSDDANPAAVQACDKFATVLDSTSTYYGDFADNIEGTPNPDYSDPSVSGSNMLGRTALRQGAGVAMEAANTPGLQPAVANPMRTWSVDAMKLIVKMGLRTRGQTLDSTVNELNNDATAVQEACATAGTHA